nr:EOG090X0DPU [Cyclestheria hislopi]
MVIKFYVSSISGNKEMKKRQMKAQLIMESKGVHFEVIDISDPGKESERRFMQANAKAKNNARNPIPPQFFNEEEYCGDYEGFDEANETDMLEEFLKLPHGSLPQVPIINHGPYSFGSRDVSVEKELSPSPPVRLNGNAHQRNIVDTDTRKDIIENNDTKNDEYEEDEESMDKSQLSDNVEPVDQNENIGLGENAMKLDYVQENEAIDSENKIENRDQNNGDEEEEEEVDADDGLLPTEDVV